MPKRNLIIIVAIIASAVVIMWITRDHTTFVHVDGEMARYRGVADASHVIRENYYPVGPAERTGQAPASSPSELELRRWMVYGMVHGLADEYSRYVPPEDVRDFETLLSGRSDSLGLRVDLVGDEFRVLGCVLNSPAHREGIMSGDVLLSVDGQAVAGRRPADVRRMLQGKANSRVELVLRRGQTVVTKNPTRQEMTAESVAGLTRDASGQWIYLLPAPGEKLAYVRIKEFLKDTPHLVQGALRSAEQIEGLVLDLRDNPGGKFESAVDVADLFVDRGTLCTVLARNAQPLKHSAHPKARCPDYPIIVLINARSASGAEIVAGALAINDRAVLVGTRTRGKGCMQNPFKLDPELGELNLTTAEYFVGDDQPIARRPGCDAWGVDPHAEVTMTQSLQDELSRMRLELELAPWPRATAAGATQPTTAAAYGLELIHKDRQLLRAIDLLQSPAEMTGLLNHAREERLAARAAKAAKGTLPAEKAVEP